VFVQPAGIPGRGQGMVGDDLTGRFGDQQPATGLDQADGGADQPGRHRVAGGGDRTQESRSTFGVTGGGPISNRDEGSSSWRRTFAATSSGGLGMNAETCGSRSGRPRSIPLIHLGCRGRPPAEHEADYYGQISEGQQVGHT